MEPSIPTPSSVNPEFRISSPPSLLSFEGLDVDIPVVETTASERTGLLQRDEGLEIGSSSYSGLTIRSTRHVGGASTPHSSKEESVWKKRVKYYVPSIAWIPDYSFSLFGGDFLAGLTVACLLIPQSVSYATSLAKLSPAAGLFSASVPGIFYALLGTSRQLNVAPEAALSLLVGQAISDALHNDPHTTPNDPSITAIAVSTAITVQVGLISFLLGFFRLGFIDVILSRALLRGFITAIAIVISIEQLIPMLGLVHLEHQARPESTLDKFTFLVENIPQAHMPTVIVSFGAFGALIGLRFFKGLFNGRWIHRLPEVLIVVIVSTFLCYKLDLDDDGIDILGSVPINTGRSFLKFPLVKENWKYLKQTTSTAALTCVIGFLDSIVAAKQNASRFQYSISPNRELVALGAANMASSFIPGTLPAYGSITRSRINGDVGGRTQMASLICSTFVLLATFFLLPWLYYLPKCVLASIVSLVIISLLAEVPHDLKYYWRMRAWIDMSLMLLTFFGTIIWNVEVGVLVSIVISLLLVVHRSSKARMLILGRVPGTDRWTPISEDPEAREDTSGVVIIRIRENLDFANTAQLKERLRRLELYGHDRSHPSDEPRRPQATVLIFHMADVETTDASAVQIFYELLETYKKRGVGLYITHLRLGPYKLFERGGIVKLIGSESFHQTVASAVAQVNMTR